MLSYLVYSHVIMHLCYKYYVHFHVKIQDVEIREENHKPYVIKPIYVTNIDNSEN